MEDRRPKREEWAFGIARSLATIADCTRRKVGAIITDENHRILGLGYNGAIAGEPGCLSAGACPRGRHFLKLTVDGGVCNCGSSWPCEQYVEPGTSYDTGAGTCIAIHAEMNAKDDALRKGCNLVNCIMWVTEKPCDGCIRHVRSAGINIIRWPDGIYDFS